MSVKALKALQTKSFVACTQAASMLLPLFRALWSTDQYDSYVSLAFRYLWMRFRNRIRTGVRPRGAHHLPVRVYTYRDNVFCASETLWHCSSQIQTFKVYTQCVNNASTCFKKLHTRTQLVTSNSKYRVAMGVPCKKHREIRNSFYSTVLACSTVLHSFH
jgi:hypothetical protein